MPTLTARSPWQRILTKRIPTVLGLGVLIIGVVAGIFLVGGDTGGFLPRASEDAIPKQVRITNITSNSFSVSFLTDLAAPGTIEYGTNNNQTNIQVKDDRDQLANSSSQFTTHHITVRGLQPSTQYYFRIATGDRTKYDNNGQPFSVRTARQQTAPGEAKTAYGEVTNEVGNPADGALVYISIDGATPLSAQVKANGSWALPLTGLRTLDLTDVVPLTDSLPAQVQVQGAKRTEVLSVSTTVGSLAPLQTLAFGQEVPPNLPTATPVPNTASPTPGTGGLNTLMDQGEESVIPAGADVSIRLTNNETITTTKPEFSGTAPAGSVLQIEVDTDEPIFGVTTANTQGHWTWSPPKDLSPGSHTIAVTYTDTTGQQQVINRTFLVQASDSAILPAFSSTPSATLAPSASPIALATAAPSATPVATASPVPSIMPTATPVATVSATAKPVVISTVSAQPVTGSVSTTLWLAAIGIIFFGGGTVATLAILKTEETA